VNAGIVCVRSVTARDVVLRQVPLRIVHRDPPQSVHNQSIYHIYHRGDVAKLQILLEFGGIYLDYDVIVVNSLDPLRRYDATLGKSPLAVTSVQRARTPGI